MGRWINRLVLVVMAAQTAFLYGFRDFYWNNHQYLWWFLLIVLSAGLSLAAVGEEWAIRRATKHGVPRSRPAP